jgi:transcriptional antiterminator NusG
MEEEFKQESASLPETAPVEPVSQPAELPQEEVKAEEPKVEEPQSMEEALKVHPKVNELTPTETMVAAEAILPSASLADRRWYVIQTFTGQEDKVKANLVRSVEQMKMNHKIFNILVPEEETVEIRGTKRVEKIRKMFPGYVFVEMLLDDETWYVIRQTPGVSKFIGSKTRPEPVVDREMQRVLKQLGVKAEKLEAAFEMGEAVRIISGPFRGYTGSVSEINATKGKLKVLVNIFGRDTPVEVNFEHAERVH